MHKGCITWCSQEAKNIVFVNGSCWAQPQGECNEKPLSTNLLLHSLRVSASASWSRALLWFRGMRYGFSLGFGALCFRNMLLERIWTCCYFWLNTVCDVETPLWAAPSLLPLVVFWLWFWLRSRASPRCGSLTVWEVNLVNNSMGAKQMKW